MAVNRDPKCRKDKVPPVDRGAYSVLEARTEPCPPRLLDGVQNMDAAE